MLQVAAAVAGDTTSRVHVSQHFYLSVSMYEMCEKCICVHK